MSRKKPLFSNQDYQYSSLPATRKEAFKDVYRHNFKTILSSGLTLLVFSIPLLIFLFVMDLGKIGMTPEKYGEEELKSVLLVWDLIVNGGAVLLLYVVLIGLMGIMRVLKLLVWQEGIDFFHDFKVGIKENFKHFSLLYLVFAIFYLLSYSVYIFVLNFFVGIWLMILYVIIFVSIGIWALFVVNVYQCNLWNYLKNAVFFYSKSLLLSIPFVILLVFPFFLVFVPLSIFSFTIKYPIILAMLILYYPCLIIIGYLYSLSKFDEFINRENYPEIYRKGLYEPNKQ